MELLAIQKDDKLEITFNGDLDMFTKSSLYVLYTESDRSSIHSLEAFCNILYDSPVSIIELNLKDVSYADSTGLALIYNLIKDLRKENKIAYATEIQERVLGNFKLLSLDKIIQNKEKV